MTIIADSTIKITMNYDGDQPFYLNVALVAPHVPLMGDPVWTEYYQDVDIPLDP